MRTLNLGILAHVDAGKTSLTERLLYAAGVIDEVGSVDDGSTQTDTLALEQERGITIKSAVVSAVVEGVQPQARVLMRTLRRLRIPSIIFVNKIDRVGAQHESLLRSISEKLTPKIAPMGSPTPSGRWRPCWRGCAPSRKRRRRGVRPTCWGVRSRRPRCGRGRTTTRSTARSTCCAARGGSSQREIFIHGRQQHTFR